MDMDNEALNTEVYKKLHAEQEKFKGWLLQQSPEEILNHAYEYTVRDQMKECKPSVLKKLHDTQAADMPKPAAPRKKEAER